jgi:hypothetical protein
VRTLASSFRDHVAHEEHFTRVGPRIGSSSRPVVPGVALGRSLTGYSWRESELHADAFEVEDYWHLVSGSRVDGWRRSELKAQCARAGGRRRKRLRVFTEDSGKRHCAFAGRSADAIRERTERQLQSHAAAGHQSCSSCHAREGASR